MPCQWLSPVWHLAWHATQPYSSWMCRPNTAKQGQHTLGSFALRPQHHQPPTISTVPAGVIHQQVHPQTAGLPKYERAFDGVVDYVIAAGGLSRAVSDPAVRAEVSSVVESAFPLAGVARFLTLSPQERKEQVGGGVNP